MAATTTAYCILSCALFFTAAQAGKILVIPADGSHWLSIKVLMMELVQRGHELTVSRPSNSMYIDETSEHFKIEHIPVPETQKFSRKEFEEFALDWVFQQAFTKQSSSFTMAFDVIVALNFGSQMISDYLGAIFENTDVMERLTNASFDLILADPYNVAGVMLAHYLKLPIVFFGRWMPTEDIHFAIAPSPLSYVPVLNSRVSDRMAFHERVKNVALYYLYLAASHLLLYPAYDKVAQRYFNTDIGVLQMYKRADIHLMKVDFVFEFPRPTMPNAIYIGGFQGRPPKPLSEDIQRFMDSSEQGVVVFSLGSLVSRLPLEVAKKIAAGLAQLKEQVIWRYTGEPLDTLGNNTMTLDWLPQNDLLGHPNTKVFLAHGGENGIYEALYHGVPIVGFPLYGDQYENLLRLKVRGAAIILENLQDITAKDIFNAVRTVIDDPSYSRTMKYLSGLHRDAPVPPLDLAVFWTEYVMRHKGARHLQPAANDLAWYQYYLLDVIGLLLITVLVSVYITIRLFRVVLRTFCCRKQNKQKQKKS